MAGKPVHGAERVDGVAGHHHVITLRWLGRRLQVVGDASRRQDAAQGRKAEARQRTGGFDRQLLGADFGFGDVLGEPRSLAVAHGAQRADRPGVLRVAIGRQQPDRGRQGRHQSTGPAAGAKAHEPRFQHGDARPRGLLQDRDRRRKASQAAADDHDVAVGRLILEYREFRPATFAMPMALVGDCVGGALMGVGVEACEGEGLGHETLRCPERGCWSVCRFWRGGELFRGERRRHTDLVRWVGGAGDRARAPRPRAPHQGLQPWTCTL